MLAPHFRLLDQNGDEHTLTQYSGKWVVLYFYPKDDTPGCTIEACGFQDSLQELTQQGVIVLGVSKDSVASHKKFAEKYHLTFPLLSDESKECLRAYGAWGIKKFMGREITGTLRNTYLINPKGEIEKKYEGVTPLGHAKKLIEDIQYFSRI